MGVVQAQERVRGWMREVQLMQGLEKQVVVLWQEREMRLAQQKCAMRLVQVQLQQCVLSAVLCVQAV